MTRGKDNNRTIPLQSGQFNHAYFEERNEEDFETLVKEDGIAKRKFKSHFSCSKMRNMPLMLLILVVIIALVLSLIHI